MTLLVSLASYMLASLHLHIYNNNTSTLYHLTWEFEKPFIISFITLRFIQPKINELLFCQNSAGDVIVHVHVHSVLQASE